VQVLHAGTETGVLWQRIGLPAPSFGKPFRLARGDVALVGADGPLVELDSTDPAGSRMVARDGQLTSTLELAWQHGPSWGFWTLIVLLALFLLLLARAAWVKRHRNHSQP
jgi:hypothetical protein